MVPDLKAAREFYEGTLGCAPGRVKADWIDVLFYDHQLTIHQARDGMVARPIDHFGPVLDKADWLQTLARLEAASASFAMRPLIKGEGTAQESGKFLLEDPAGNLLEFKYYEDFRGTMAGGGPDAVPSPCPPG